MSDETRSRNHFIGSSQYLSNLGAYHYPWALHEPSQPQARSSANWSVVFTFFKPGEVHTPTSLLRSQSSRASPPPAAPAAPQHVDAQELLVFDLACSVLSLRRISRSRD
ncbi:hypothetical protein NP233_g10668 [Leucocoprinus birnbaumii]|uniref:Uncharacterized protein n=1 Tax=Leucocoprinus birnbaumii TaxID=56174 RepID=A0AAD5VJY5_9AGAR|nr:hypothetical protein NP233_g10668 [Leucocoprinus birnbaumii]